MVRLSRSEGLRGVMTDTPEVNAVLRAAEGAVSTW